VQVEIGAVPVAAAFRREGGVAAVHGTRVHQLQVHVLEVRLHAEVVLEDLAALRALARVVLVQSHVQVVADVTSDAARLAVVERAVAHVRPVAVRAVAQYVRQMALRLSVALLVVVVVGRVFSACHLAVFDLSRRDAVAVLVGAVNARWRSIVFCIRNGS